MVLICYDYECKMEEMEEDLILLKFWLSRRSTRCRGAAIRGRDFADGNPMAPGAFCTGVLWALAEQNRLRHVTHLSSVSGGLWRMAGGLVPVSGVGHVPILVV